MRVVLFHTEELLILSYPAMALLAMAAGLGTLAWRLRSFSPNHASVLTPLTVSLLAGWIGSRLAAGWFGKGGAGLSYKLLLPTEHVPSSFSIFLAIMLPVLLMGLGRQRDGLIGRLDVLAPSVLIGFAVAKIGCLLAGCCAGDECPPGWGIRYPYGSHAYALQVARGTLDPPEVLLNKDEDSDKPVFGHIDFLRAARHAPPPELVTHAEQHGMTYAAMLELAEGERAAPVWPVPLFYAVSSGMLWLVAEVVFARSKRAGWTTATVLIAYAIMRLALDPLLAVPLRTGGGIIFVRTAALLCLTGGVALAALCLAKKTPRAQKRGRPPQQAASG